MAEGDRVPIDAQSVDAPLSRFAVFLVMSVDAADAALEQVRDTVTGIDDLVKTVGFRDLGSRLSCVVSIGSELWGRLRPAARPRELHPFVSFSGSRHSAPATPGDLLFHIRADRQDIVFEFERLLLDALRGAATVVDESQGFRYFDARDLLGFVDGTANPVGAELPESVLIGEEDPDFAGGSYVVVQKYLHDLGTWQGMTTEAQEAVIGRTKLDNIELDDGAGPQFSHKSLATIDDGQGGELDILRDNMPFGRPGHGEFGTYFIGYSRRLWVIERMLQRMFVGEPAGYYDRILDVSTAITGTTFFTPSRATLLSLADGAQDESEAQDAPPATAVSSDHSLGIGSLRPAASQRPEGTTT